METSVGINPSYAPVYIPLAAAMLAKGDFESMLEYTDRAIRISPNDPAMWAILAYKGSALRGLSNLDNAIATFERACTFPEAQHNTHLGLAVCYAEAGRLTEAAAPLARAREIEPRLSIAYISQTGSNSTLRNHLHWLESLRKAGLPEE